MKPLTQHTGIVAPLEAVNVDTDQIMPKQWLKRIERTGYDQYVFYDWRYNAEGKLKPDFEMNQPRYQGASILLTKDNFGCGSSREHAVWGLENYGFRVILAPSFADIFYSNCFNNGVLPVVLPAETIEALFAEVRAQEGYKLAVDLQKLEITKPDGSKIPFELDEFRRYRLLNGLDQIGLTLLKEDKITEFEKKSGVVTA